MARLQVGKLLELPMDVRDRAGDNFNRGQKVRIKLRNGSGDFESFEHILKIMLHELCHCEHGAQPWPVPGPAPLAPPMRVPPTRSPAPS